MNRREFLKDSGIMAALATIGFVGTAQLRGPNRRTVKPEAQHPPPPDYLKPNADHPDKVRPSPVTTRTFRYVATKSATIKGELDDTKLRKLGLEPVGARMPQGNLFTLTQSVYVVAGDTIDFSLNVS